MILFQPVYEITLNQIYRLTGRIPEKIRHGVLFLVLVALELLFIAGYSSNFLLIKISLNDRAVAGTIALVLLCIFSVREPLKRIRWNIVLSSVWIVFSLIMLLSGFDHIVGDGYRLSALVILVGFPCLAFVWNNRGDYETLYALVAKALCFVSVIYFLLCLLLHPEQVDPNRYTGTIDNPNTLGLMAVSGVISAAYLLVTEKKRNWLFVFPFGTSIAFAFFSASRNSLISIALVMLVLLVYVIRGFHFNKYSVKKSAKCFIVGLVALVAASALCIILLGANIASGGTVVSAASAAPPETATEYTQKLNNVKNTADLMSGQNENVLGDRFKTEGRDLNAYSAGRVEIWKAYAQRLNWKGNDIKKNAFPINTSNSQLLAAHNVYLEIAYRSGIVAGVAFLIFVLIAGIKALCCLFGQKQYKPYYLFMIMVIGAYSFSSLLESLVYPFSRSIVFLFWLSVIPLLPKSSGKTEMESKR